MKSFVRVNKEVNVTSLYFRNSTRIKTFPRRMEYNGQTYTFVKSGLECRVKTADNSFHLFDMTDGKSNFRLKLEDGLGWKLMSMTRPYTSAN